MKTKTKPDVRVADLHIRIDADIAEDLRAWAKTELRSVSNMSLVLIEEALAARKAKGDIQ